MSRPGSERWTYDQERESDEYVIRAGEKVIGKIGSKGDVDLICRARRKGVRDAMRFALTARQHRLEVQRLRQDIRILMLALHFVADALKQKRPREVTAAREEATKILRKMQSQGHHS